MTLFILKVLSKPGSRLRKLYNKMYYFLFWNGITVYILESYSGVTLGNLQFLLKSNLNWNNPVKAVFGAISIITLFIYTVVPIYLVIYFRKNVHRFHLSTYRLRFKEAIDGL